MRACRKPPAPPPWMDASPMGESAADGVCPERLKNDVKVPALLPKKLLLLRPPCRHVSALHTM